MKFKLISLITFFVFILSNTQAQKIVIADSINPNGFYTEVKTTYKTTYYKVAFGNKIIDFNNNIKGAYFFGFAPKATNTIKTNNGMHLEKNGLIEYWLKSNFKGGIQDSGITKIYFSTVRDSLFAYNAFYVMHPKNNKWVYMGSVKSTDTLKPKFIELSKWKKDKELSFQNTWLQVPTRKGWIALDTNINKTPPVMRPFSNVDSLPQITIEQKIIADSLKNTAIAYKGLFYTMLQEGTGAAVNVTDNVTIFYKGSLFSNGNIFDQTKDKPITFPLNGLIQGWQIGMPLCKVGGKIRLYIPSGLAYGIRNISAEIPPNSTLVFDIEVVDAKQ